jgi:anaerobic magnesium-protoporphyrin IX monomethyl ester cyclase
MSIIKFTKHRNSEVIAPIESIANEAYGKDWATVNSMMSLARKAPQHNLTNIELTKVTRQIKLSLVMVPPWGIYFPPYNLARLAGITNAAGFKTNVYDINVKAWRKLKTLSELDLWDHAKEWMWQGATYVKHIHPLLDPILKEYIEKIVSEKPDIVGFSLYYTNESPTNWMALHIKKLLPNVKIVIGGPQAFELKSITMNLADYVIQGEGEQTLLNLLDNLDQKINVENKIIKAEQNRLDLDSLPFPDYSYFDFNDYLIPNGISSEFTRGCVAKCVFCTETNFWKYRGRMSGTVLDEVKHQFITYGSDYIWFIDSLLNGNITELRAFALGLKESKLPIGWTGNVRCDGRMDLEYFQDLSQGGCKHLLFGIESGSQLVLDHMRKNVTVEEIEQNFKDAHASNILVTSNWIVGFPSEDSQCFADTLTLASRLGPCHGEGSTYGMGITLSLSPGAEITDNKEKFNIVSDESFEDSWNNENLTNTKLHRLIRQKSFAIFLYELSKRNKFIIHGLDAPPLVDSYKMKFNSDRFVNNIEFEKFDYNIITPELGEFADSAVNQIWPLLRTLWRTFGAYEIDMKFDPQLDLRGFGNRISCDYQSRHHFIIDDRGFWKADFIYNFQHQHGKYQDKDYGFTYLFNSTGTW